MEVTQLTLTEERITDFIISLNLNIGFQTPNFRQLLYTATHSEGPGLSVP